MSADRASTEAAAPDRDPRADVVIAATACLSTDEVLHAAAAVREALVDASGRRVVLIHADTAEAQIEPVEGLTLVPVPIAPPGPLPFGASEPPEVLHALAAAAAGASARAVVLVGSAADGITADTVATLATPVLDHGIDLVCPIYPRHHLDGLINRGIVVPLTGALYGQRVDGQLGLDFAFSPACLAALAPGRTARATARPLWPVTRAIALGMRVAQARLARWAPIDVPVADASAALLAVLGSLFADVEANAAIWQRLRGSRPVPVFGASLPQVDEPRAVDVGGLIESFEIGRQNLQDVWGRLMPPATLMELNRVSRHPAQEFRLPDRLWARIVFDFALGYRLRTISRDHVLRAMTPLYLAWTASFVSELQSAGAVETERRSGQLAAAYEAEKPYLVARWRWPDRFNP